MVVCCMGQAEVVLRKALDVVRCPVIRLSIQIRYGVFAARGDGLRQHNDGAVETHLYLKIALRTAVVGMRTRRRGYEGITDRAAWGCFACQQALLPCRGRRSTTRRNVESRK